MIDKAGLSRGRIDSRASAGPPGVVLDQSLKPGTEVPLKTPINLVVSQAMMVAVPDVTNRPVEEARAAIERAGLSPGAVVERPAPGEAGLVVEQSVTPGSRVPLGTIINIEVAQPPPPSPQPVTPPLSPEPSTPPQPPVVGGGSPPASTRPLKDRFDEIDTALNELVSGNVALNTPERMWFRESRIIALIASPELDAAMLAKQLRDRIGGDDLIAVEALQIAPLMEANLTGAPAFEVVAVTPNRQVVSRSATTEWRWRVRANEAGKHTLHLAINAVVSVDGERFPRSLSVLNRDIEVEIAMVQQVGLFVQGNWQWLAGTIIIPVAVWLWTSRGSTKRKRRK